MVWFVLAWLGLFGLVRGAVRHVSTQLLDGDGLLFITDEALFLNVAYFQFKL